MAPAFRSSPRGVMDSVGANVVFTRYGENGVFLSALFDGLFVSSYSWGTMRNSLQRYTPYAQTGFPFPLILFSSQIVLILVFPLFPTLYPCVPVSSSSPSPFVPHGSCRRSVIAFSRDSLPSCTIPGAVFFSDPPLSPFLRNAAQAVTSSSASRTSSTTTSFSASWASSRPFVTLPAALSAACRQIGERTGGVGCVQYFSSLLLRRITYLELHPRLGNKLLGNTIGSVLRQYTG